jgi:hypothetical protein
VPSLREKLGTSGCEASPDRATRSRETVETRGIRGKVVNFDNLMFDVGRGISQFPTLSERRKSFFPRVATDPQSLKREEREKSLNSTGKTPMQVAMESESEVH